MADPKKGTGKKPKGSGRRLYTDENPKDTVGIKFATPTDARKTVAKVKRINKPYARKIQILTVGEQRAKVMGKSKVASIFKKGKESSSRTFRFFTSSFLENKNLSISIIKPRLFAQASNELNKNFNDTLKFIKHKIYGTTNNSNKKED